MKTDQEYKNIEACGRLSRVREMRSNAKRTGLSDELDGWLIGERTWRNANDRSVVNTTCSAVQEQRDTMVSAVSVLIAITTTRITSCRRSVIAAGLSRGLRTGQRAQSTEVNSRLLTLA